MQDASLLLRNLPPSVAAAPAADDAWARGPLSGLSDGALVAAVGAAIEAPKCAAESSFVTHAPLELLARAALLAQVEPKARDLARRRIASIAARYAMEGEEVEPGGRGFRDTGAAIEAVIHGLDAGDAASVDSGLVHLAPRLPLCGLRAAFAGAITPFLGAAGHAPILLAEFPRIEGRIAGAARLLRAPLRAIARRPEDKLSWQSNCRAAPFDGDAAQALTTRFAAASPVRSTSLYIAPTMLAVEAHGHASAVLGDVTAAMPAGQALRAILRVAAHAMLQDDSDAAPYGWTHALTMPLAVLANFDAVEDKIALVRVAATYALGFRATMGKVALDLDWPPPLATRAGLFDVAPIEAAGTAFHAPAPLRAALWSQLATSAAIHADAHLVKYTLAAMDASAQDREAEGLYIAAAAYLGAWWDGHPTAHFES